MSQNHASDFSSFLNSSQYLLPTRMHSSDFFSELSICAYSSTPAPWYHLVQSTLIVPLNQTFMRSTNELHRVFFSNQRLVTKNFCCCLFLFLQVRQKKERFFSTCTSGTPPEESQQNFTEYKIHTNFRVSQKVILNGFWQGILTVYIIDNFFFP